MATIDECLIDVEFALAITAFAKEIGSMPSPVAFRCPQCRRPVQPYGGTEPHFKHHPANPRCDRLTEPAHP